jgi:hypothetical protein
MGVPFFMFVLLSKSFYIYGVDVPSIQCRPVHPAAPGRVRPPPGPKECSANVPRMFRGIGPYEMGYI